MRLWFVKLSHFRYQKKKTFDQRRNAIIIIDVMT